MCVIWEYILLYIVAASVKVPSKVVKVKLGENCIITCNATGDKVPTTTPWLYKDKPFDATKTKGANVTTVLLQDTIGVMSTITFDKLAKDHLGSYICQAENKKATITLVESGEWTVKLQCVMYVPDTSISSGTWRFRLDCFLA